MIFTRIARLKNKVSNVNMNNVQSSFNNFYTAYNSSTGRLRVMLPATVSPYLR